MVYAAQTNWKYDKNLYHPIQSGPQRTGDNLNLTDTYLTISSGYVPPSGVQQTWYGVNDEGADFGRIPVGPPNLNGYFTTDWRAVPPAISGYWTNYENIQPHASGLLDSYVGFRAQGIYSNANASVQTAYGPEPGLRNFGTHTWYGEQVPDNQLYSPFQTPSSNDNTVDGGGITGGGVTHPTIASLRLLIQLTTHQVLALRGCITIPYIAKASRRLVIQGYLVRWVHQFVIAIEVNL